MVDFFTSIEAYFTATPAADDHFAVPKGLGDRRLNQRVSEYGFLAAESVEEISSGRFRRFGVGVDILPSILDASLELV